MNIIFDITRLLRRSSAFTPTGIDRVELAYARHLREHYPEEAHFIGRLRSRPWRLNPEACHSFIETLTTRWEMSNELASRSEISRLENFLEILPNALAAGMEEPIRRSSIPALAPSLPVLLSPLSLWPDRACRRFNKGAVYLNVSHEGLIARRDVSRLVEVRNLLPIYLVHDLIPISHPEYARPGDREKHEARMRTVLNSAVATLTNSEHTSQMLSEFATLHGLNLAPTVVSPLGVEQKFHDPVDLPPIDTPYFVMIGTIEPRKNHLTILHLWRHLAETSPVVPKLIVIGRRGWENENVIDIMERCDALSPHVIECNRLPDQLLRHLMANARAVLMPSFAEGYGLPLAEALTMGAPAICSDLSVFREIAQDAPDYISPIDGAEWMRSIVDYAKPDSKRRAAQIERLAHFKPPTWEKHFAALDHLIELVHSTSQRSATAIRPGKYRTPSPVPGSAVAARMRKNIAELIASEDAA